MRSFPPGLPSSLSSHRGAEPDMARHSSSSLWPGRQSMLGFGAIGWSPDRRSSMIIFGAGYSPA